MELEHALSVCPGLCCGLDEGCDRAARVFRDFECDLCIDVRAPCDVLAFLFLELVQVELALQLRAREFELDSLVRREGGSEEVQLGLVGVIELGAWVVFAVAACERGQQES